MDINELPVAVIDSGIGGISVLRALIEVMPNENYLYFGDSANAPYGSRSKADVLQITRSNLETLKLRGIKALVIACNTATGAAITELRQENPNLIIVGIEPAIKPAALLSGGSKILVMATPLTLSEDKFLDLAEQYNKDAEIIPLPCPKLAELIETGDVDCPSIDKYVTDLLEPYKDSQICAIVLGCTHYPHVKHVIERHAPKGAIIFDGSYGTAKHTQRRIMEGGLLRRSSGPGYVEITNSSDDKRLIEISNKLLYK